MQRATHADLAVVDSTLAFTYFCQLSLYVQFCSR
jgi:hypothetical protein